MDLLKYSVVNGSDIKDLLVSLDKAIKVRLGKEGYLESRYKPRIYLGESMDFVQNEIEHQYERPFITFNVIRRGPASLSDTNFFTGQLQHGPAFKLFEDKATGESRKLLLRDNEVKLVIRAKTKSEIYFLLQLLERVIVFEQKLFPTCHIIRFVESKDNLRSENGLFLASFVFRARTGVVIKIQDDAIFEKMSIIYKNTLCKFYDVIEQKCVYNDIFGSLPESEDYDKEVQPPINKPIGAPEHSQRQKEANDIQCYESTPWCSEHKNISLIKTK